MNTEESKIRLRDNNQALPAGVCVRTGCYNARAKGTATGY